MPVPVPTTETPAPRRLLRDVVYDKMVAAIIDGTLELGERLNDDELVTWLGVSRTPVREAIAKLAEQALVDIEANRYTRIIQPTHDEFVDTIVTGYQVWSLLVRRGVAKLSDDQRDEVIGYLDAFEASLEADAVKDADAWVRANQTLLAASGSSSLRRLWASTGPRVVLVMRRASAVGFFPVAETLDFTQRLRAAIVAGDAESAGHIVESEPEKFGAYFEAVRENGLYPAVAPRR